MISLRAKARNPCPSCDRGSTSGSAVAGSVPWSAGHPSSWCKSERSQSPAGPWIAALCAGGTLVAGHRFIRSATTPWNQAGRLLTECAATLFVFSGEI